MVRALVLVLLSALLAAPALAHEEEGELPAAFSSDRPGFAFTPDVAAQNRITTELGATLAIGDPIIELCLPSLSLRAGVLDWLELRVRGPNAIGRFGDDTDFGIGDAFLGFKIGGLLHESLSISMVWEASLPIATDGFGAEEAELYAHAQLEWRFWGPLSVTPHAFAAVIAVPDPVTGEIVRVAQGGGSLKVSWDVIDVLTIFVQSFVYADELSDLRVAVGGGVAWLVLPNVQIDAGFDIGVTSEEIPPPTVSAGTTILW